MKIASWNVNSLNVRLPRVLAWLAVAQPDVLCLQETKMEDAKFPRDELARAGYAAHYTGQRTYNGVALLVRDGAGLAEVLANEARLSTALTSLGPSYIKLGQFLATRDDIIGRELAASAPHEPTAASGAPIFRHGSGSSDVLHALLHRGHVREVLR